MQPGFFDLGALTSKNKVITFLKGVIGLRFIIIGPGIRWYGSGLIREIHGRKKSHLRKRCLHYVVFKRSGNYLKCVLSGT